MYKYLEKTHIDTLLQRRDIIRNYSDQKKNMLGGPCILESHTCEKKRPII